MEEVLPPLLATLRELAVLAAIGNEEATTYRMSFAYMAILLLAIALGFIIMLTGLRIGRQGDSSPLVIRNHSSYWITKYFVVGWGLALLSAFIIVLILPYSLWYYTQEQNDYAFGWCYQCNGLPYVLGPEMSIIFSIFALIGLGIGIILVTIKGRERIDRKSR